MKKQKRIVNIGTHRLKKRVLTLIMILTFIPQLILSQEVNTNLVKQTVTLSKEKTIDVAKIIKNEERLRAVNLELLATIKKQDSTIKAITIKNVETLKTVELQNEYIVKLSSDVLRYSDMQLGFSEKKTKNSKFYLSIKNDYVRELNYHAPGLGADFYFNKIGLGASGGIINKEFYIGGRISFAIW